MSASLSSLIDDVSEINKKELTNEFIDSMRSMSASLSSLTDDVLEINKKERTNEFIDSMRSMLVSLSSLIDDVSEINKKEPTHEFIDSMRSMSASLSSLIDDVSEIHKKELENEFVNSMRSMLASLLSLINDLSEFNKKISLAVLIENFPNTYQLCNKDLNKFALLLRKGIYPYEYMDSWERFNEESLPDKESFYSELYKEDITDEEYEHAQKVWKVFKIKNVGEYHDLYVQSSTSLLSDVFENFRDKCIEIYELELDLIIDEEGTRGGMCHATYRYAKANNKHMKNYDINIESSFLEYDDANNLYGWAMSQKLPVGNF